MKLGFRRKVKVVPRVNPNELRDFMVWLISGLLTLWMGLVVCISMVGAIATPLVVFYLIGKWVWT